jgi:signal peptidase
MKLLKIALDVASWFVLAVVVLMITTTIGSNSNAFGKYRSLLVQSGSMEPTIMTGDIIVIQQHPRYGKNDVVTFNDGERVVTHRIIKESENGTNPTFQTKGDANRSADEAIITKSNILGAVVFTIPKLGYMVAFGQSLPGLIIFVLIPATLLVVNELIKTKSNA